MIIYSLSYDEMSKNDESTQISTEVQKELNKPLANPKGMTLSDQQFLDRIIKLVNEGKLNLFSVDSVINHAVYDSLLPEQQSKVEIQALTVLSSIREIKGLYDAGYVNSYQIQNLVEKLKLYVSNIEENGGDVFII
jgi:hypothetical protein